MWSVRALCASALCAALLSLLSGADAQPPTFNLSTPSVIPHSGLTTITLRQFPMCAYNLHQLQNHGSSTAYYQMGGFNTNGGGFANSLDFCNSATFNPTNCFTYTPTANFNASGLAAGYSVTARLAGGVAVLPNGNLLLMGGKIATSYAWVNDVVMSTNAGASWTLVTAAAAWGARSDFSLAVQPYTSNLVLCAGVFQSTANPPYGNDCWLSTDGQGATWTQRSQGQFFRSQQMPMTFLFDATSATSAATLVIYDGDDNYVYRSLDWAQTFTKVTLFPIGWPQQTGRLVADLENNLYMAGGVFDTSEFGNVLANEESNMFFSPDKGNTWSQMPQIANFPGLRIADSLTVGSFQDGCLAISYIANSAAPGNYRKQLLQFGGQITNVVQNQNSWLNCSFVNSLGTVSSVINEVLVPGEPVAIAAEGLIPTGPNIAGQASLVFRNAANQILTWRWYADCTVNVHAAVQRSSNVASWQLGGFTIGYTYINTIDYSPTGQWNTYQTITPTYLPNSAYPTFNASAQTGKVGAGVVYLSSGNLLLFGGKDSFGPYASSNGYTSLIGVTNDVFLSTDQGNTWSLTLQSAPWAPRSDMAVAVMPGTNYVVMGGGQTNPNYLNIQDFWITQDGMGQTWTKGSQTPQFGPFQDAAMVFMYDNKYVNPSTYGSQAFSTLLINTGLISPTTNADAIYKSLDGGVTWAYVTTAPWTQRLRQSFTADMENYVYMSGGQITLGDIWVSTDFGANWALMLQTPSAPGPYQNIFSYQGSQMNCVALRYFQNSNSPSGFHKQLVMFGGPNTIYVAQQSAPECVTRQPVNVVYGEIMYPQEYAAGSSFTDTSVAAPPSSTVPTMNFNGPSSIMPNRLYPECASDVHAVLNGRTPMSYALGGTDPNFIALPSIDRFSGSSTSSYQTVTPTFNLGYARSSLSRWASGAAVLNNGNLLWFAGKLANFAMSNDVWYSSDQGNTFNIANEGAPWPARSDLGVASIPGTNCVLLTSGANWSNNFNDVWSSCDGYGVQWVQQTGTAPWPLMSKYALFLGQTNTVNNAFGDGVTYSSSNPSIVALYDNTASNASQPTSTIVFYTATDNLLRTSNNMGATWTSGFEVPWQSRVTGRFVADSSNNVYLVGGSAQNGEQQLAYSSTYVVQPDVWFSWNKGATWVMLQQNTNAGYSTPVTLALASYACAAMVHSSGHRQVLVYSGQIDVYNNQNTVATGVWFNQPQCTCTSQTAQRSLFGDLIFPSEGTPNNLPSGSSSSSSSNTFSQGQTAGIAVGVGVGCMLLCCLFILFAFGAGALTGKATTDKGQRGGAKKFEDEPSSNAPSTAPSEVQMNEQRA